MTPAEIDAIHNEAVKAYTADDEAMLITPVALMALIDQYRAVVAERDAAHALAEIEAVDPFDT